MGEVINRRVFEVPKFAELFRNNTPSKLSSERLRSTSNSSPNSEKLNGRSVACWEQERLALVKIKKVFTGHHRLQNWVEGDENSDCCLWESVICNSNTGRVKQLYLDGTEDKLGEWYLNASLFNPFQEVESLYLQGHSIAGCIENEGFERLSKLNNLTFLELSLSFFNNSILSSLNRLSSLRYLGLFSNKLKGTIDVTEIDFLSNLEELYLSNNRIDKFVVPKDYKGFKKLNTLALDGIGINDKSVLLQSTRSPSSLKVLDLGNNNLIGAAFSQGLYELVQLQELYVDYNDIRGSLPWCLANMTSLQILDISYNQLTMNNSSSPLVPLTSIQELILLGNLFQIPISLEPFFNHSDLMFFIAEDNQFYAEVESSSLVPRFQLNSISLSGQLIRGTFPQFLYHEYDLRLVSLSNLNLIREFPKWLLESNTNLYALVLVNNSLAGSIQLPSISYKQLRVLNIYRNAFNVSIPSSFGNLNSLQILDLSNNQLTSEMGCFSLQLLVLSNNNLQGRIFSKSFNLRSLWRLHLDGNHFIGGFREYLSNCSLLAGLYLSDNSLSGRIPRWLDNMSNLEDMIIPNNHLEGPISIDFCHFNSLEILDSLGNNLSGSLRSCFSPFSIKQVHLAKNMLQGKLKDGTFYNSSSLVTLDLSYNYINGSIPKWIDILSHLRYLLLANNKLEGEVSIKLCRLNKLRLIDLSHNHLSGQIPSCLHNTSLHKVYYTPVIPVTHSYNPEVGPSVLNKEIIKFTTKERSYSYRGRPLESMFRVDLSCNNLTGQISPEIGYLMMICALNLSRNNLSGSIPFTFSNLKQIESLDLSYNKLSGKIPPQLVELNTFAVFNVAHNNLSGKIPEWIAQFATFNASSYEENPLLCGLALRSCNEDGLPSLMSNNSTDKEEDGDLIDMESFFVTFTVSYIVLLFGFVVVLYVNPYWRRKWFYLIDLWMTSCLYFVEDNLKPKRFFHKNM